MTYWTFLLLVDHLVRLREVMGAISSWFYDTAVYNVTHLHNPILYLSICYEVMTYQKIFLLLVDHLVRLRGQSARGVMVMMTDTHLASPPPIHQDNGPLRLFIITPFVQGIELSNWLPRTFTPHVCGREIINALTSFVQSEPIKSGAWGTLSIKVKSLQQWLILTLHLLSFELSLQ